MEIEIDKRKVDNSNASYQNVWKVINGDETNIYNTTVYNLNSEKAFESITNKVNYSDFYKQYLNKFDELEDYAYHLVFPKVNKKIYEFKSTPLILGKKIVDWIFGLSNFPDKELLEFYNIIKLEFDLSDNSTICKRWKANFAYFSGNLKKSTNEYNELFDYAVNCNDFPIWYLDDICIDGRNILHQYENTINLFSFDNKYQRKINENKHKLSYPDIDRIKSEIFDSLSKTILDNKNKSKDTIIYGIGLEECFKQIQQLVYLVVFYGSITHMRLIRELIANVMYMYAITFEDENFYKMTLKMLFLSGEFKKYKKLYNKIKLEHNFVHDEEYINSLIEIRKSLFRFEIDKNNIFLYDVYGRYIDDVLFDELTNNIYSIIDINKDYQRNIVSDAFKSIGNNMLRNKRIGDLLNILKSYFEKDYSMFYIDFGKIIKEIKVKELSQTDFKNYIYIIDLLMKNKRHINFDISDCVIKIKQRNPKIKKYDKLFKNKGTTENILYNIEIDNNELEAIKNIVNIFKERHIEREKNPSVFKTYFNDYNIGVNIFEPQKYNDEVQDFMLKEYLPLAKEIIISKNETLYEKVRHIKVLAHLAMVEKNEEILEDIYSTIHNSLEISSPDKFFGFGNMHYKNKNDLIINVMMCDVIMEKIKFDEVLNHYIEIVINSTENIEEVLRCVEILNNYLKIKSMPIIEKQYILFNICYNVDDIDIRNMTVIMSNIFMDVDIYREKILRTLENRVKNITFEELNGYFNLITKFDDKSIFNNIIKVLKNNRNYYIKYFSNEHL